MNKVKIDSYPMLNPAPVALVGAYVGGRANFAAVGAFGMVCLAPVLYVSLKDTHHTTQGVRESGYFSVNIPNADMVAKTDYCGMGSGRAADKSALFALFGEGEEKAPLIAEAPLGYVCRVEKSVSVRGFDVFFGEIVSAYLSEDCLTDGRPDAAKIAPLVMMMRDYYALGDSAGQLFRAGRDVQP